MKGQPLLRLADLSTLWLDVRVPQGAASSIQPGYEVTATLDNASKDEVSGAVVFLAPEVDEATRTTTVRIAVDNRDLALRPGTFARAAIAVKLRDDAVLAPAEAVLDTGGRKVVWVAVGKGRFAPQAVHTGATDDEGNVEITDGLAAGQQVVVSGQFLIDSESRLREGSRKFEEDGLMKDGELPPPASVPLSPESQRAIDAVFAAYIRTSEAFADDRFDLASWNATKEAADAAVRAVKEPQAQLPITEFARQLDQPNADIEAARVAWKKASILAIALFEVARPRGNDGKLYVHHCPMAEADWLQIDDKTRNPYYGSSMLECGEVRRSMPFSTAPGEGAGK
jgi:Cu(I)/Ag(I) efflux system membrane fusion protein